MAENNKDEQHRSVLEEVQSQEASGEGASPDAGASSLSGSKGASGSDAARKDEGRPSEAAAEEPSSLSGEAQPPRRIEGSGGALFTPSTVSDTKDAGASGSGSGAEGDTLQAVWQLFCDTFSHRYAQFDGRANRTEFWVFFVGSMLIEWALNLLAALPLIGWIAGFGSIAWWIASLVPNCAVAVRRLHDTGRSGAWIAAPLAAVMILMLMIPLSVAFALFSLMAIGPVLFICGILFVVGLFFCALAGQKGPNEWGPQPRDLKIF